jgi:hypothetical protein
LFAQAYIAYYLVVIVALAWDQRASDTVFLAVLLVPITLGQLRRVAWSRYQALIEDEHVLGDDVRSSQVQAKQNWCCRNLEQSYWDTWLSLLGFGMAIIILLIYSVDLQGILGDIETPAAKNESGTFRRQLMAILVCIGAATSTVLAGAALSVRRRTPRGRRRRTLGSEIGSFTFAAAATGIVLWLGGPWILSLVDRTPALEVAGWRSFEGAIHLVVVVVSLPVIFYLRRMTDESLQYNIARVESGRLGRRSRSIRTLAGLAVASNGYWLLTVGIWNGHSPASLPVVAGLTAIVTGVSVIAASLVAMPLFRAIADIGVRPRHLALHHPISNVFQDHVLMFALMNWALVAGIYTAEILISYWSGLKFAVLPLFLVSPFGVFFVIYVFMFKKTDVTSRQHVWRERARISHAMLVRADDDLGAAREWNEARADLIARRFSDIQEFAGRLMFFFRPAIALSDWVARLLPDQPLALDLIANGPVESELQVELGQGKLWYSFTVKGFESTPLDLALHLKRPGDPRPVPVKGFSRERDAELLYVPLAPNDPPGIYELIIDSTSPENGGDLAHGLVISEEFEHRDDPPRTILPRESTLTPDLAP